MRRALRLLLFAWPLVELVLFVMVGQRWGGWWVFWLIVVSAIAGVITMRIAGRSAMSQMRAMQADPNTIVVDADGNRLDESGPQVNHRGLLALAGFLLMLPGLISDAIGLILLLPPVRAAIARNTRVWAERRITAAFGPVLDPSAMTGAGQPGAGTYAAGTPSVEVVSVRPVDDPTSSPAARAPKAIGPAGEGRADESFDSDGESR